MSKIVTFEQAKKLKELGFDGETHKEYRTPVVRVFESGKAKYIEREPYVYDTGRHASFYGDVSYENYISAPTVSDALDWVREDKRVICAVDVDYFDGWYYTGKYQDMTKMDFQYTDSFDDHPLASSALLDAVLTYLEQKEQKIV